MRPLALADTLPAALLEIVDCSVFDRAPGETDAEMRGRVLAAHPLHHVGPMPDFPALYTACVALLRGLELRHQHRDGRPVVARLDPSGRCVLELGGEKQARGDAHLVAGALLEMAGAAAVYEVALAQLLRESVTRGRKVGRWARDAAGQAVHDEVDEALAARRGQVAHR